MNMTKDMIDGIQKFIDFEKERFNRGDYEINEVTTCDMESTIRHEKDVEIVNSRFNEFQLKLKKLFYIGKDTYDINYLIPYREIKRCKMCVNVKPSDIVYEVIESLITLINVNTNSKIIMKNDKMKFE